METQEIEAPAQSSRMTAGETVLPILVALSICHMLNDTIQSVIPAIYPLVKDALNLNFTQIGLITLTFNLTASLLQPCIGIYTDKHPKPFSLASGMTFTLGGLVLLAFASTFPMLLVAVAFVGVGSAVFHPEASRVGHMASGGRHGFAQSLFQVGGNAGTSLGPLLAALIITGKGHSRVLWFGLLAVLAIGILTRVGSWYSHHLSQRKTRAQATPHATLPAATIAISLSVLIALMFSKFFYLAGMGSYYTFYLIHRFHLSVTSAQLYLFVFLFSSAAGTFAGGPLGDKFGRKHIIWVSILGAAPFALALPYANLFWTAVLTVFIGAIMASAFSAILVYAQELVPGRVGMVAGLFFGLAFGLGGIGSALLGRLADHSGIEQVFHACSFLPLIGLLTGLLPNLEKRKPV
jgi:FSR family fosmidomycin resistance protein-like MFS transporter